MLTFPSLYFPIYDYPTFLSPLIVATSIFIEDKVNGNSCKPQNKIFQLDTSVALRMMLCK